MALFGGGGSGGSKTTIKRPDYINSLIGSITQAEKQTKLGDYSNLQYAGLDEEGQQYLEKLMNNEALTGAADQLLGMGEEGLKNLDDYYNQIANVYNNTPTTEDINNLATQLYSSSDAHNQITAENQLAEEQFAQETAPSLALQFNQTGQSFGSDKRRASEMAKMQLARGEQANASQISSDAYQNAMSQAQSILSGQQSNRRSALSALGSNIDTQVGALSQAQSLQQQAQSNALNAANYEQQQAQTQADLDYQNKMALQQWGNMDIENRLNLANTLNAAKGMTTTTKTTGGKQGVLGGALGGAISGFMMGGPYGKFIKKALSYMPCLNFSNCWKLLLGHKYELAF